MYVVREKATGLLFPNSKGYAQTKVEFSVDPTTACIWGGARIFTKLPHVKLFLNQYCKGQINQSEYGIGQEAVPGTSRSRDAYEILPVTLNLGEPI